MALLCIQTLPETGGSTAQWRIPQSGRWSQAANWDPARLPGPLDDVVISVQGNYTVTADTQTSVASLVVEGSSGYELQLDLAARLTVLGRCDVAHLEVGGSGRLHFRRDVVVRRNLVLRGGGALVGTLGRETVLVEGDITVFYSYGRSVSVENSVLEVHSKLWMLDSHRSSVYTTLQLADGASILLVSGAELSMDHRTQISGGASSGSSVESRGHIECKGPGMSSLGYNCLIAVHLLNKGTVSVDRDAYLYLSLSSETLGSVTISDGATLYLVGTHIFNAASGLTVHGLLNTNGEVLVASSLLLLHDMITSGGTMQVNVSAGSVSKLESATVTNGVLRFDPSGDGEAALHIDRLRMSTSRGLFETSLSTTVNDIYMTATSSTPRLEITSSLVVTGSLRWTGGTIAGSGSLETKGPVQLSPAVSGNRLYLNILTSSFGDSVTFKTAGALQLGTGSSLTVLSQAMFTIAAAGSRITGSHAVLVNRGTIQTAAQHAGTSYISTTEFNNNGHVIIESDLASTLVVSAGGKLEGTYEVGDANELQLQANVEGNLEGSVTGRGSLTTSGSSVWLANVNVSSVLVTGGSLTVATPLIEKEMTLTTLEVTTGGTLTVESGITLTVGQISVSDRRAVLELNGPTTCDNIQLISGLLHTGNSITVSKEFVWTEGTVQGSQDHYVAIRRLFVYSSGSKSLSGAHLLVQDLLRISGHGLTVQLSDGAFLETAVDTVTDILGSSVTITSSDDSSVFLTNGEVNAVATALSVQTVWHILAAVHLTNSDVKILRSSVCKSDITVGQNSSVILKSAFTMFPKSQISGSGSLVSSASSGVDLYNAVVGSITVTAGHVTIHDEYGNSTHDFTSILVNGGGAILEVRTAVGVKSSMAQIRRLSVQNGQFISWMSMRINELIISGGVITFQFDAWVTQHLEFISGRIEGPSFDQVFVKKIDAMHCLDSLCKLSPS